MLPCLPYERGRIVELISAAHRTFAGTYAGETVYALELRGMVPIDFESDADLHEGRSCPGH